jgi:ADP-ribose pyrophosphatase YjhB (NUDIX family)
MVALVVMLGFLMVSTFRYRSFKGVDLRRRRSYISVLGIALLFLIVASQPETSLLAVTALYTLSGPAAWAYSALRRRPDARPPLAVDHPQPSREPDRPGRGGGRRRDPRRQGAPHPQGQATALRPLGGPRRHGRAGEPLEEALVREMREETGLEVEPLEVLTVFDRIERDGDRVVYHYVIVDYLCRWLAGDARAASDALEAAWAAPEELARYDLPQKALEVVQGAFSKMPVS